jgi:hypothetical protein
VTALDWSHLNTLESVLRKSGEASPYSHLDCPIAF